jgi:hypothetical protein
VATDDAPRRQGFLRTLLSGKDPEPRVVGVVGDVDAHPPFVKWAVFVPVLGAIAAGSLGALELLAGAAPRRSPWLIASFVAVLPLLLGFFEPTVPLLIEEEGGSAVIAAVILWLALIVLCWWLWPHLRDGTVRTTAGHGVVVAIVVSLTLFLAWAASSTTAPD